MYDEAKVMNICSKYQNEMDYISNLEKHFRSFQITKETNPTKSFLQNLKNIRHTLVRVQIMRILKREEKSMLEEVLVNNDNEYLYNKFIDVMNNN